MIKKVTIRFNLDDEQHRSAYEILAERNRCRYKSFADYVVPAVIQFADQAEDRKSAVLSELDRQLVIKEILNELDEKSRQMHEPGI